VTRREEDRRRKKAYEKAQVRHLRELVLKKPQPTVVQIGRSGYRQGGAG